MEDTLTSDRVTNPCVTRRQSRFSPSTIPTEPGHKSILEKVPAPVTKYAQSGVPG